jgi:hypothetical protein
VTLAASIEEYAEALAAGIEAALPGWVIRCVERIMRAWAGEVPPDVAGAAVDAGRQAQLETGGAIRALLAADIDDQRTTPLTLLRQAVKYPTAVLRQAGVPPVERDQFTEQAFPDDVYDLSPASWSDIDPGLTEPGINWGAAKAFEHKRRR